MHGLKIGHFTNDESATGVSVFLFEHSAVGAYCVGGSAPATHELAVLEAENSVPKVYGLVLAGGSAYGLHAAEGVMRYLTEQHIGHPTPHGVVPIVPAAAIYDLAYVKPHPPTANDAYQACLGASETNSESGRIGAGRGATIGKLIPNTKPMTGGLGRAQLELENGVIVLAYVVVNCVGDVRNAANDIIAGARDEQEQFANCEAYLLSGQGENDLFSHGNTTLAAVFTNAAFSKSELKRIAKMALAGMGRAIAPVFTRFDGDIVFCISVGEHIASELTIGTMAAEAVRLAIIEAVKDSEVV